MKPNLRPVPAKESEPEAGSPASGLRPTRLLRTPPAGFLPWALFAVALAAAIVFALLWQRSRAAESRAADVKSTATRFLQALTNFRGDTIEANVADIRSFAVGDFADQVQTFFSPDTMDVLKRAQAVSTGKIQSVFVESVSGGTASVFGVVNESVTNVGSGAARTEVVRVHMEMIDTSSGWKISRVDILQSPTQGPFSTTP